MAQKEWKELLDKANENLKETGIKLQVFPDDNNYSLNIKWGSGETDEYATGYYEDELVELINEAWSYALAKKKDHEEEVMFLVSVLERDEDEYDFYQKYKLFTKREDAERFYEKEHKEFLQNFGDDYVWLNTSECNDSANHYNTYTWNGGENHYEITITEVAPE